MKKLTEQEVSVFCAELSMLLSSGMSLEQGIIAMEEEEKTEDGKRLLSDIYEQMEVGSNLYNAMKETECFPTYVTDMVHMGEETGNLDVVFKQLSRFYDEKEELMSSIKSAVVYPFIMAAMMLVVLVIMIVKVLPMISQVYYSLGSEVPASVRIIMQSGRVVTVMAAIFLAVLIAAVIYSVVYSKIKKGKKAFDIEKYIMKNTSMGINLSKGRFASVLSMVFASGIDVDYGIDLADRFIENNMLKEKIAQCKEQTAAGESLVESIEKAGIFEGLSMGIFAMGMKSGNAAEALKLIADRYNKDAQNKIAERVSAIEPIMVIVLSVLIGIILIMVMLPLLGIMSVMG